MTENKSYQEYCNEYPLIIGCREITYESWLKKQMRDLCENIINNVLLKNTEYNIKKEIKKDIDKLLELNEELNYNK